MYCGECGKKLDKNSNFCPYCGASTASQNIDGINSNEESVNVLLVIASFFVPVLGLVLFAVYKDTKKKTSKACGIAALVSFILNIVITIFCFIYFCFFLTLLA